MGGKRGAFEGNSSHNFLAFLVKTVTRHFFLIIMVDEQHLLFTHKGEIWREEKYI